MKKHQPLITCLILFLGVSLSVYLSDGAFAETAPPTAIAAAEDEAKLPFEPDDTLEEIRYKIDYNGYDFTVSDNHISRMSREEKDALLSRHRSRFPGKKAASTGQGPLIDRMGKEALPSSFDWRNYNAHSYIGPILDQGNCGACYAFGAAAAAEGTYNWANGLYDGNRINFSEAFIAFCLSDHYSQYFNGCDGADWDYYELEALIQYGICLASSYPYTDYEQYCLFSSYPPLTKFQSWHRISCGDIAAIKTAIMTYGVVDAAVNVTTAFEDYKSGIYQDTATSCPGDPPQDPACYYTPTNHAISLVGWNDNGGDGYWILRNSYGTDWGESGYMRIKYTSARVACEVTYLVSGGSDYRVLAGGDYNGDTYDDIAIFRPSSGLWSVRGITRVYFGASTDDPVPGDYDGDGTTDIAIFRDSSGLWAITGYSRYYYGSSSDTPVPNDYNGNGRCNLGIFRPSSGLWAIRGVTRCYYGSSSDTAIPGDYNGDGTSEPGIYRESSGLWSIRGVTRLYFGSAADTPVPGWHIGTYHYSPGIYRASSGLWAIRDVTRCYFGGSLDQPVPADFNNKYGDDIAIFRPTSGLWAIREWTRCYFGTSGDIPVTR